jgi:hypothetical protein
MGMKEETKTSSFLFHLYNWIIPLIFPALLIIIFNVFFKTYSEIVPVLLGQIYLFCIVVLSTNLGLLMFGKNNKGKDNNLQNNKNTFGLSCLFLLISVALFTLNLVIGFPDKINIWQIELLFISIPFTFFTIRILHKNPDTPFSECDSSLDTTDLSKKREKANDLQISKFSIPLESTNLFKIREKSNNLQISRFKRNK